MKKRLIYILRAQFPALVLAVIFLLMSGPLAYAATSMGNSPDYLAPSEVKTFVRLSRPVLFFKGDTYASGAQVTVPAGTVCQLVSTDFYAPSDGNYYYSVYYESQRYNALMSDLQNDIISDSDLLSYITGTLWRQSLYTSLKKDMNLMGDVRVYALQYALKLLGYYSDTLDGNYGDNTENAVCRFQKANGLTADGSAGVLTQPVLYSKALLAMGLGTTSTGTITTATTVTTTTTTTTTTSAASSSNAGTLKTTSTVNLRKTANKSSARLAVVPKGISLTYTSVTVNKNITWYKVSYNSQTGWLMGTYVSVSGSGSSSSGSTSTTVIGTILITKGGTRVRTSPNGAKSGTLLSKGTMVSQLSEAISAGGYSWYKIKTGSGMIGYVRGDCAQVYSEQQSSSGTVSSETLFIKLPSAATLFTTQVKPITGTVTAPAGSILRLYDKQTYTLGGVTYCSVYYNNIKYNCVYAEVSSGIMSSTELYNYISSLWGTTLTASLKKSLGYYGNIYVYALQVALNKLGLFSGTADGTFGTDTETAVRNFQRQNSLTIDGMCGANTWKAICAKVSGSSGSGSGSSVIVADFGTVSTVKKVSWNYDDNGAAIFPKGTYATVMDVETGKVFNIYRWSGGSHADCVPASASDTKIMCDIVGYPYNSSSPSSAQLEKIKADGSSSTVTYTWPDFKNSFGGSKDIGSAWDRRPCLVNVDGTVYAVSIYGFPHGFNGTDSFSKSKFPSGSFFYETNNYYGMMCIHFVGSKTHGGSTVDSKHQAAIETAYAYAQKLWPTLCK